MGKYSNSPRIYRKLTDTYAGAIGALIGAVRKSRKPVKDSQSARGTTYP